jgi:predicted CopG family antitoxin
MSGRKSFSELTKNLTPADRRRIEEIKAEMCATLEAEAEKSSSNGKKGRDSSPVPH